MTRRRIFIDCGNTRLKWAVAEDGTWRARGDGDYSDWSALTEQISAGGVVHIASVAAAAHERTLAALLADAGNETFWLSSSPEFDGIRNTYHEPAQLGVDRWMAIIAARQHTRAPLLVVSAGTALTVDAVSSEGVFLGGLIVPGLRLMMRALADGTARIADGVHGHWRAFPRNTADAVRSGAVAALCGAIGQQHTRLAAAEGTSPACLLTGGDATAILPHLPFPAEHVPALVLEGIARVAEAGA